MRIFDRRKTILSLAVRLVDDFGPAEDPVGYVSISLEGHRWFAHAKRGSVYTFHNLPTGSYVLTVRSAYYRREEVPVAVPQPPGAGLTIRLQPRWLYPFPPASTLIIGRTVEGENPAAGIPGVKVQLNGRPLFAVTDEGGYFALYFRPLSERDVTEAGVGGKCLVKATSGGTDFQLAFTHDAFVGRTLLLDGGIEAERILFVKDPAESTALFGHVRLMRH